MKTIRTETHEWELDEENSKVRLVEVHTKPKSLNFMDRDGVPWCYKVMIQDGWVPYESVSYSLGEPLMVFWIGGGGMKTKSIVSIT